MFFFIINTLPPRHLIKQLFDHSFYTSTTQIHQSPSCVAAKVYIRANRNAINFSAHSAHTSRRRRLSPRALTVHSQPV